MAQVNLAIFTQSPNRKIKITVNISAYMVFQSLVYVYVCVCVIAVYVYVYCMYVHICMYMYVCMYVYASVCTPVYAFV